MTCSNVHNSRHGLLVCTREQGHPKPCRMKRKNAGASCPECGGACEMDPPTERPERMSDEQFLKLASDEEFERTFPERPQTDPLAIQASRMWAVLMSEEACRAREAEANLREEIETLLARADEMRAADHACSECVPGGELVREGSRCALHAAKALVGQAPIGIAGRSRDGLQDASLEELHQELAAAKARAVEAEGLASKRADEIERLRAALKGLSCVEKWWPTLQARGLCWCGFHSAEDRDHAPHCQRAAEALK